MPYPISPSTIKHIKWALSHSDIEIITPLHPLKGFRKKIMMGNKVAPTHGPNQHLLIEKLLFIEYMNCNVFLAQVFEYIRCATFSWILH